MLGLCQELPHDFCPFSLLRFFGRTGAHLYQHRHYWHGNHNSYDE